MSVLVECPSHYSSDPDSKAKHFQLLPPQLQRCFILISASLEDFEENRVLLELGPNAKAFYKRANPTNAASLLEHFLQAKKQHFYLHQGHVTLMLTFSLDWMKSAHPEGFTCF
jgi:hypothetical protein